MKPAEITPIGSSLRSLPQFLGEYSHLVRELHAEALCERWGVIPAAFAESLRRSAEKRFGAAAADSNAVEAYLRTLNLEDLALACACSEGIEKAWEFFIAQFRQDLRHAANAMLRASGHGDDARAEELADSLYADLYGVRSGKDGNRKSLFEYFHGRSKLSTWLRAVLAQRQVDLFRSAGKTVSLDAETDDEFPRELAGRTEPVSADPDREKYLSRFDRALSAALAGLTPRERLILSGYYVDQLTLAEIGRMMREHESTVSRKLERMRRALREDVTKALRCETPACDGRPAEPALDMAQVELIFEYAVGDWPFDLSLTLSESEPGAKPPEK
jgi:RNA polymerase sigma-70 factor